MRGFTIWLHFSFRLVLYNCATFVFVCIEIVLFCYFYFIQKIYWFTHALVDLDFGLVYNRGCVLWTAAVKLFGEFFYFFLSSYPSPGSFRTCAQSDILSFAHGREFVRWDSLAVALVAVGGLDKEASFDGLDVHHGVPGVGVGHEYLVIKKPSLLLDGLSSKKRFLRHGSNPRITNLQDPNLTRPSIVAGNVKTLNKFINVLSPVAIWLPQSLLVE